MARGRDLHPWLTAARLFPEDSAPLENQEVTRADFERYFPYTPAALCVKECARLSALRRYEVRGPILDVGCGDGLFASIAFDGAEVWGIDIDADEGRWAAASQAYTQIILGDVTRARLPESFLFTVNITIAPGLSRSVAGVSRFFVRNSR